MRLPVTSVAALRDTLSTRTHQILVFVTFFPSVYLERNVTQRWTFKRKLSKHFRGTVHCCTCQPPGDPPDTLWLLIYSPVSVSIIKIQINTHTHTRSCFFFFFYLFRRPPRVLYRVPIPEPSKTNPGISCLSSIYFFHLIIVL